MKYGLHASGAAGDALKSTLERRLQGLDDLYSGNSHIPILHSKRFGPVPAIETLSDYFELAELITEAGFGTVGWRGHADSEWRVDSGLFRVAVKTLGLSGTDIPLENHEKLARIMDLNERKMLNAVRLNRIGSERAPNLTDLEIMAMLQHFGAATRLVDFTRNAAIALWFACREEPEKDGLVFSITMGGGLCGEIDSYEKSRESINEILSSSDCRLVAWAPSHLYERMRMQQSLFLISLNQISSWGSISPEPFGYVNQYFRAFNAIGVPKAAKPHILLHLSSILGLRPETLFPDVEGFARAYGISHVKPLVADGLDVDIGDDGTLSVFLSSKPNGK